MSNSAMFSILLRLRFLPCCETGAQRFVSRRGEEGVYPSPSGLLGYILPGGGQAILKLATDCLSSRARSASSPTDWAVRLVPSVVCLLIDRMSWMPEATRLAACAWLCVVVEISSISAARRRDTSLISPSA